MPSTVQWENMFDEAVDLAARRKLSETLSKINRIRSYQRRQGSSLENNSWHVAELLYLEAVVLERARHFERAKAVRMKLAKLYLNQTRLRANQWLLPFCQRCASRKLDFAPNWFTVAKEMYAESLQ